MITIKINGEDKELSSPLSLKEILERFQFPQQATAIALNQEVVPKSEQDQVRVKEGDRIEIVRAVGGG